VRATSFIETRLMPQRRMQASAAARMRSGVARAAGAGAIVGLDN
jgi:hypothetical protein